MEYQPQKGMKNSHRPQHDDLRASRLVEEPAHGAPYLCGTAAQATLQR